MPVLLEQKLKREYADKDPSIPYRIMNNLKSKGFIKRMALGDVVDPGEPDPEELAREEALKLQGMPQATPIQAEQVIPPRMASVPATAPQVPPEQRGQDSGSVDSEVVSSPVVTTGQNTVPDTEGISSTVVPPRPAGGGNIPTYPTQGDTTPKSIPQRLPATEAALAKAREIVAKKETPMWRQALGTALSISPHFRGVGDLIAGGPQSRRQLEDLAVLQSAAEEERRGVQGAETSRNNELRAQSLAEERKSLADSRLTNAQARNITAQNASEANRRKTFEDSLKIGGMGGINQSATDPIPKGKFAVPDPVDPSKVYVIPETKTHFVVNPGFIKMAESVGIGGLEDGSVVSMDVWQKVADAAGKVAAVQAKPEPPDKEDPYHWNAIINSAKSTPEQKLEARNKLATDTSQKAGIARAGAQAKQEVTNTPADPLEVDYWTKQVQGDAKNFGLIKNKGLQQAVSHKLAEQGVNVNQIDAQTRDAAKFSQAALSHINKIDSIISKLEKSGQLGPVMSRWNDFMTSKVGVGPEFAELRNNVKLLTTAMGRVHGGARGGSSPSMIAHLNGMLNASTMDPATLRSGMGVFKDWLSTYASMVPTSTMGSSGGGGGKDPLGIR